MQRDCAGAVELRSRTCCPALWKQADLGLDQQQLQPTGLHRPAFQQSVVFKACCTVLRIRRGLMLGLQGLTVSHAPPKLRPATHRSVEISQQVVRERRELAGPRVGRWDGDHLPRRRGWGGVHPPCGLADPSRHLPASKLPSAQAYWALCTRQQRWSPRPSPLSTTARLQAAIQAHTVTPKTWGTMHTTRSHHSCLQLSHISTSATNLQHSHTRGRAS